MRESFMIAYKSADQLAKLIKDKEISSVELLDYYISRVEKYNSDINAIIVKDYEKAKKAALKADEELSKGNILEMMSQVQLQIQK